MNSRERILAAIHHQPVDRVPLDFWGTPEVVEALQRRLGPDWRGALHLDGFGGVGAKYVGPAPQAPADEVADYWGVRSRKVQYDTGVYWENTFHPLAAARTIDDLEAYAWPSADWFDTTDMRANAAAQRPRAVIKCGYMAIFYLHNKLRGLEQSLVDPLEDPDFTHHLLQRVSDVVQEQHRRMFEACDGLVEVAEVTDDLGSQTGPLMSLNLYREFYRPHHARFIRLCQEWGIKVFHHDDGAMSAFLPDLLEMGIDILNPVQWTCPGMELEGMKQRYGDRLCFHGGIENQKILPFGTPDEVRAEVRHCIDILAQDKTGYILAPCHNIQPVTPTENILALYDEAWTYGAF